MQADVERGSNEQIELLEMRVTRLERILAAQAYQQADHLALKSPVTYAMDDPRLVLFGAYEPEPKEGTIARWFGKQGQVQMVFPHGRGAAQTAQLLMRPFHDNDLRQIRLIIDEAPVIPKLIPVPTPSKALVMEFPLPPAYGFQTEIQMNGLPLKCPRDVSTSKDPRIFAFLLYAASFTPCA